MGELADGKEMVNSENIKSFKPYNAAKGSEIMFPKLCVILRASSYLVYIPNTGE